MTNRSREQRRRKRRRGGRKKKNFSTRYREGGLKEAEEKIQIEQEHEKEEKTKKRSKKFNELEKKGFGELEHNNHNWESVKMLAIWGSQRTKSKYSGSYYRKLVFNININARGY